MLFKKCSVPARTVVLLGLAATLWPPAPAVATHTGGPGASPVHGIPVGPGLFRLHGTDPDLPRDDLEALHFIVGNATFVALGESIHTSGGFYEMKHRILRFLVEEMGFRALGFENPWVPAEAVREYVETCEGSSLDALRNLFGVWESRETLAMIEWMCQWNQEHPDDPVHFYGIDIQNFGDGNTTPLVELLARLGRGEGDPLVEGIQSCDGAETFYFPFEPFPEELYELCQNALAATARLFEDNERRIVRETSKEELAWARVHLVSAQAWQEQIFFLASDLARAITARDRGMAFVATAIRDLRFPRSRVVLWGHNDHISKNGPASTYGFPTLGTFMSETFGRRYVSLALAAFETYLEWPSAGFCGGPFFLFGDNPVEESLEATGESALLLDFDPRGSHPTFLTPGATYSIGGVGSIPEEQYDGMIYLEVAPAMDPLFTGPPCP